MSYIPLPNKSLTKYVYNVIKPVITAPNVYNTSTIKKEDKYYVYFKGYKLTYDSIKCSFNQVQNKQSKLVINNFHTSLNNKFHEHLSIVNSTPNYTDIDLSRFSKAFHEEYTANKNKYFAISYKAIDNKIIYSCYNFNTSYKSFDFIENELLNELPDLNIIFD